MYHRNYMNRGSVFGTGVIAFIAGAVTWALFGRKLRDKIGQNDQFQRLKGEVYDKASRISDLTQEKYDQIVEEVSNKYASAKGISQNELRDLVDDLKWHWHRIKSSWRSNRYSDMDRGI